MIISPNENGWSYDDSTGNWKLVYSEKIIVFYEQTDEAIATGGTLFVGAEQECEDQIKNLELKYTEQPQEEDIV